MMCFGGADFSETSDLAAFSLVSPTTDDRGRGKLLVNAWHWCPDSAVPTLAKRIGKQFWQWIDDGWLKVLPAGHAMPLYIAEEVLVIISAYPEVMSLGYDPKSALDAANRWRAEVASGARYFKVQPVYQATQLNETIRKVKQLVEDGGLWHPGNPVLDYCVGCSDVRANNNRELALVKIERESTAARNDGLAAVLTAVKAMMLWEADPPPPQPEGIVRTPKINPHRRQGGDIRVGRARA